MQILDKGIFSVYIRTNESHFGSYSRYAKGCSVYAACRGLFFGHERQRQNVGSFAESRIDLFSIDHLVFHFVCFSPAFGLKTSRQQSQMVMGARIVWYCCFIPVLYVIGHDAFSSGKYDPIPIPNFHRFVCDKDQQSKCTSYAVVFFPAGFHGCGVY